MVAVRHQTGEHRVTQPCEVSMAFSDEVIDGGFRVIAAALSYDFGVLGFYGAINKTLHDMEMPRLESGSPLSPFFAWQYDEYMKAPSAWLARARKRSATDIAIQLHAAAHAMERTLATDPDAIARVGDPDERDALMACYEAAQQDEEARLRALKADRAARLKTLDEHPDIN